MEGLDVLRVVQEPVARQLIQVGCLAEAGLRPLDQVLGDLLKRKPDDLISRVKIDSEHQPRHAEQQRFPDDKDEPQRLSLPGTVCQLIVLRVYDAAAPGKPPQVLDVPAEHLLQGGG